MSITFPNLTKASIAMAVATTLLIPASSFASAAQPSSKATSQNQVEPRGEAHQFHATINNRTRDKLIPVTTDKSKTDLIWGKWMQEPTAIPEKTEQKAFASQGRQGSPSGTEGWVTYYLEKHPHVSFKIYFDTPASIFKTNKCEPQDVHRDLSITTQKCPQKGDEQHAEFKVLYDD
ncbi:hypothetical protein ALI144C_24635 [Actinosynnema sp. ALI-1.44]|uniref:aegerolysin family protein n=1 Tax=Actinosynnema sp. ALI-1.44 TaxID=1933779 RepID=UPI00097C4CAC|nr:aegerolysin family protein [Actinosynnema sp. ALI-1.44]ONI79919.1 hypothetical protein ALI144C_24635 [Actinosynnema sp. ALI-1.44]